VTEGYRLTEGNEGNVRVIRGGPKTRTERGSAILFNVHKLKNQSKDEEKEEKKLS